MRNGICPKCNSREIISGLWLKDYESHPPYVEVVESFFYLDTKKRKK